MSEKWQGDWKQRAKAFPGKGKVGYLGKLGDWEASIPPEPEPMSDEDLSITAGILMRLYKYCTREVKK